MGLITKIGHRTPKRAPPAPQVAAVSNIDRPAGHSNTTQMADHAEQRGVSMDSGDASTLPPPIPCLICSCPAIWSTIYEPTAFRCADCEPPPGGWHWLTGGWSFVARRLMLVVDVGIVDVGTDGAERWWWDSFPRIDWKRLEV